MLVHEQYMFGDKAYSGLSKDDRGSIADADVVIIFGVSCKLVVGVSRVRGQV
jgi:hypothetical protein